MNNGIGNAKRRGNRRGRDVGHPIGVVGNVVGGQHSGGAAVGRVAARRKRHMIRAIAIRLAVIESGCEFTHSPHGPRPAKRTVSKLRYKAVERTWAQGEASWAFDPGHRTEGQSSGPAR